MEMRELAINDLAQKWADRLVEHGNTSEGLFEMGIARYNAMTDQQLLDEYQLFAYEDALDGYDD